MDHFIAPRHTTHTLLDQQIQNSGANNEGEGDAALTDSTVDPNEEMAIVKRHNPTAKPIDPYAVKSTMGPSPREEAIEDSESEEKETNRAPPPPQLRSSRNSLAASLAMEAAPIALVPKIAVPVAVVSMQHLDEAAPDNDALKDGKEGAKKKEGSHPPIFVGKRTRSYIEDSPCPSESQVQRSSPEKRVKSNIEDTSSSGIVDLT